MRVWDPDAYRHLEVEVVNVTGPKATHHLKDDSGWLQKYRPDVSRSAYDEQNKYLSSKDMKGNGGTKWHPESFYSESREAPAKTVRRRDVFGHRLTPAEIRCGARLCRKCRQRVLADGVAS